MAVKDVSVRLLAVTNQYKAEMAAASRSTQQFAGQAQAGSAKASGAMSGIGLAAVAAVGYVTDMSMDFETSMTKISALVGIAADDVDAMRGRVLELSGETAKSPQELADALFFITSAGLEGEEALAALENAAKASAAGLGDTATIADALTSAMNAYAAEGLTAAEATDVLTAAVREGKLEPDQLAGSLGKVIPIAAEMGVEFDEVAAAIATMSRAGINADEGTTALRGMLTGLLAPSAEVNDALGSIGLSAEEVKRSLAEDGLLETLRMLKERTEGTSTGMEDLFPNVRALAGVMNILGGDAEATGEIFQGVAQSAGDTDKAFGTMAETSAFKFNQMLETIKASLIDVGGEFANTASQGVEAFNILNGLGSEASGGEKTTLGFVLDVSNAPLQGLNKYNEMVTGFLDNALGGREGPEAGAKWTNRILSGLAIGAQEDYNDSLERGAAIAEGADRALLGMSGRLERGAAMAESADRAMLGYAEAMAGVKSESELAEEAQAELEAAIASLFDEVANNLDTMFDYEDALLDLAISSKDYADEQEKLEKLYRNGEINVGEYAQGLRELRQDEIAMAEAALGTAQVYAEQQGAVEGSTESYRLQKEELLRLADQFPLLRDEISQYIEELNRIPGVIGTQITIGYSTSGTPIRSSSNQLQFGDVSRGGVIAGATGGIVNRPTFALIGEAGPEAVIPLNRSTGNGPLPGEFGNVNISGITVVTQARNGQQLLDEFVSAVRRQGPGGVRRAIGVG